MDMAYEVMEENAKLSPEEKRQRELDRMKREELDKITIEKGCIPLTEMHNTAFAGRCWQSLFLVVNQEQQRSTSGAEDQPSKGKPST
jgi:hypothetical protein